MENKTVRQYKVTLQGYFGELIKATCFTAGRPEGDG